MWAGDMLPSEDGLNIEELYPADKAVDVYEGKFGQNSNFQGKKYLPPGEKLVYAREIVDYFDSNGDGALNGPEFQHLMEGSFLHPAKVPVDAIMQACGTRVPGCDKDVGYTPEMIVREYQYENEDTLLNYLAQVPLSPTSRPPCHGCWCCC